MARGWVYVLESAAKPGTCKVGATRSESMDRVMEQIYAHTVVGRKGRDPVTSKYWKVEVDEPFWVEKAVHMALDPWLLEGREVFAIPGTEAWEVAKLAASAYQPGMHRAQYNRAVWEIVRKGDPAETVSVNEILDDDDNLPSRFGRSSLYLWMLDNFHEFEEKISNLRPSWLGLAASFTAHGITDKTGERVTPETARKTWYRVRKDFPRFEKARATMAEAQPDKAPPKAPPPIQKAVVEQTEPSSHEDQVALALKRLGANREWLPSR